MTSTGSKIYNKLPGIFPVLRVLANRRPRRAPFLVLGSAWPRSYFRQGSETLAGRIVYHELKGLALNEVGVVNQERLWLRGGFPRSYLARTSAASQEWHAASSGPSWSGISPNWRHPVDNVRRFWTMLAHYHGQTWNSSEFARSFGVADTTVRHYLDILTSALVSPSFKRGTKISASDKSSRRKSISQMPESSMRSSTSPTCGT